MLAALLAAASLGAAPARALAAQQAAPGRLPWRNWSGLQECFPKARLAPASVAELQEILATATGTLRPVGAGHSFTPLVPTDGTLISLARLSGLVQHDAARLQATFLAGTRLGDMGKPLEEAGQALENMPDVDEQALAGCLATATHGTGAGLGCMSTSVRGLQLVTANGDILDCSAEQNPEVFQAALVSLGTLGVITQVRLQNVAPYSLRRETVWREFDEIMDIADDMADQHRNFEFFYIPFSGMGFTDVQDLSEEAPSSTEKLDTNEGVEDLKLARDWLHRTPKLRELLLGTYIGTLDSEVTIERSWKNYASERNVRFNEMEYHLPREHGLAALREIRRALETQHHEVFFPIEFRYVRGDDIWMSPFHGRDSCSIAVHRYFEEDFAPYFKTIEPIMRKYHGRPHWGKLNTLTRDEFRGLYPRWDDFNSIRRELDPQGRFLNPYLAGLFA